jgi:hypothetical protein
MAASCGFPPDHDPIAQLPSATHRAAPRRAAGAGLVGRPAVSTPTLSFEPAARAVPAVETSPFATACAVAPSPEPIDAVPTLHSRPLGQDPTAWSGKGPPQLALRVLAERDASPVERPAPEARGCRQGRVARRSRRGRRGWLRPLKIVVKAAPGWYFGTNVSNRDKAKLLEAACRVGGLTSGVDLVYSLPNAKA